MGAREGVEVVPAALWTTEGRVSFVADGADAGHVAGLDAALGEGAAVRSVRLADVLGREHRVDLLKLDVEGAEIDLLVDAEEQLNVVDRVFVEYHSFADRPQKLDELLLLLTRAGYRLQVHQEFASPQPFLGVLTDAGMDMRLNVFAWRPEKS